LRILLINSLYHPDFIGGAERSVQALAEDLAELGHDVSVACTRDHYRDEMGELNGVRVHYLTHCNRYWTFEDRAKSGIEKALWHARDTANRAMADKLRPVVLREQPDLIHTNNLAGISTSVWGLARELGIPVVHTLRDYYLMCPRSTMYARGASCARPCFGCRPFALPRQAASRGVSAVVGISAFILRKHRENGYFPASMAEVIPNGYDAGSPPRAAGSIGGPIVVGYLGALTEIKGIDVLLQAVADLPDHRVTCEVGGTASAARVEALRSRYGRPNIRFRGKVSTSEFLASLDVLVVPSLWEEPLGRVILEAKAHGVPVIVTPRGGMPEVVRDGLDGIILPDVRAESIRSALLRLAEDRALLDSLKRRLSERIESSTVRDATQSYINLYKRCIGSRCERLSPAR
jgi:glycosyltransferase involved in cell wall biosynthesis